MPTDQPDDNILQFVLFQLKQVKLYNLPANLLTQLATGNGIEDQVECIWTGSIKLIREIKQKNTHDSKNHKSNETNTNKVIPAFTQHRLKLEFINNHNGTNLWGETWYAPINNNNKHLRTELGLVPREEDVDTAQVASNVQMKQIIGIAHDGTTTIKELSHDLGIVSTQWFRVIVQLPNSGYHPLITDSVEEEEVGTGGGSDLHNLDDATKVAQIALLLRFRHDIDSEEFLEHLENYNMRYDHLQQQYYYDQWAQIFDQDTVLNGGVDDDDDDGDKSKGSLDDDGGEDLSLTDNENNYETADRQTLAGQSSESEEEEDDDFGDFISK